MTRRGHRLGLWLAVLIVFLAAVYGLFQLAMILRRPMFHNILGKNDRMPFYMWLEGPFCFDQRDNLAIADYRLNLLVVFLIEDSGIDPATLMSYRSVRDGVVFPNLHRKGVVNFHVPRLKDTLIVFHADGSRENFPLLPGEGQIIHKFLDVDPPDLRPLVAELYTEKHPKNTLLTWIQEKEKVFK